VVEDSSDEGGGKKGKNRGGQLQGETRKDSDDEESAFSDDLDDEPAEGPTAAEEIEVKIPLRRDGKPMSEIDLYIHKETEDRNRRQRIARPLTPCADPASSLPDVCGGRRKPSSQYNKHKMTRTLRPQRRRLG
jgi:hypothetical protein